MSVFVRIVLVGCLFTFTADALSAETRSRRGEAKPVVGTLQVELDGMKLGRITLAAPIEAKVQTIEYQDGDDLLLRKRPGRAEYSPIKLLVTDFGQRSELFRSWIASTNGNSEAKTLEMKWVNTQGNVVRHIRLMQAWVSGVSVSPAGEVTVSVESEQIQFLNQ